ncbi:sensor histidine kinase [Jeotgalibacillus haloalkalitolerans]|uniref:Signal transduction histidine-protein kinase ArlS n=1 Tax=Jeotgalibacillus haloalkalitolerans TaxID=3104292 RepID=A0ABU5KKW2_9BACL|nr:HAMP domain-containing histidine kinase [Jeotgalibacillus sp. HH7-29]MDZ5711905.1 HAMP domain-containing histidine kinase [Jeotgalibacillus sp. HH7-29]
MNRLKSKWNTLSIRWKWMLSASATIFLAFTAFSVILIIAMSQWMIQEERNTLSEVLTDLEDFYENRNPLVTINDINEGRELAEQIYERGQIIHFYNEDGYEIYQIQRSPSNYSVPFKRVEDTEIERTRVNGASILVGRTPVNSNGFNGYIEIIHPLNAYTAQLNYMIFLSLILLIAALLFSSFAAYILSGTFIKPVIQLGQTMKKTQQEGFQHQLPEPEHQDEVGGLIEIFNDLMTELEKNFAKQKQFTEDASHEMRTPIQIIEGHLNLIQRWGKKDPDVLEESLDISLQEINRMKKLVADLLMLSRADREMRTEDLQPADCSKILMNTVNKMQSLHKDRELEIKAEVGMAIIGAGHLEQVLIILIENAIKYSPDDQKVLITGSNLSSSYEIKVEDFGEGIPKENLPFIFDRFYRVEKSRSREMGGNGLGLSIAKRLLDLYRAEINIQSEPGHTVITIHLNTAKQG